MNPADTNPASANLDLGETSGPIVGLGPCAACGRSPALGFASVYSGGVERWYCHPDDGPSCYAKVRLTRGSV